MNPASKTKVRRNLRVFAIELVIYSGLVTVYFLVVLHFLSDWLVQLETRHVHTYAIVAILLIIGQAAVLEAVTTGLLRLLRRVFRR
jgi:cytochrome c biogenesis protein CcdA